MRRTLQLLAAVPTIKEELNLKQEARRSRETTATKIPAEGPANPRGHQKRRKRKQL
jgi:hypothetical protein